VLRLSPSEFGHCRHDFPRHKETAGDVVPRYMWYLTSQKNGASALGLAKEDERFLR
jgi:hypothetical protein